MKFLVSFFLLNILQFSSVAISAESNFGIKPKKIVAPDPIIFFDSFEYSVKRSGDSLNQFQNAGWTGGKAINLNGKGQNRGVGYIYTVKKIPGYSGPFPGKNSNYVLALESRASTFNKQTDFYLHYGKKEVADGLPANLWLQFWIYINSYDDPDDKNDQLSHFGRNGKFIYPTKDKYPTHSSTWLLGMSANSKEPLHHDLGEWPETFHLHLADYENIKYRRENGKDNWKIGPTNLDEMFSVNRWILVKLHIDTSSNSGRFEQWLKPMGSKWTKVAEYIDGVTPNFSWKIPDHEVGGHKAFRMPTTHNPCRPDSSLSCDWWIYLDDFTIANSENALPVYPN